MVLYTYVDRAIIPLGTLPIELLVGNPDKLDESEVRILTNTKLKIIKSVYCLFGSTDFIFKIMTCSASKCII